MASSPPTAPTAPATATPAMSLADMSNAIAAADRDGLVKLKALVDQFVADVGALTASLPAQFSKTVSTAQQILPSLMTAQSHILPAAIAGASAVTGTPMA